VFIGIVSRWALTAAAREATHKGRKEQVDLAAKLLRREGMGALPRVVLRRIGTCMLMPRSATLSRNCSSSR
jgi:hypothetical protein